MTAEVLMSGRNVLFHENVWVASDSYISQQERNGSEWNTLKWKPIFWRLLRFGWVFVDVLEPVISLGDLLSESSYWSGVQFCAHICLKTIFNHPKFRCAAIATSVRVFCNQAKEADTSKGQQCVWNMPINDTPKVLTSVHDPRESWDAGDREPRQMIWIKCLFF